MSCCAFRVEVCYELNFTEELSVQIEREDYILMLRGGRSIGRCV